MESESQRVRLDSIAYVNPVRRVRKGQRVPFIDMAALPQNARDISHSDVGEREAKGAGAHFQNGDTLLARITPCLENGKTAQVHCLNEGDIGEGSTEFIVLSGIDPADNDFVYYLCRDPSFREYAIGRMEGTSGRQRVTWPSIAAYEFLCPPPGVRRSAPGVLAVLDDRIDLLRQTNATLESIAQSLFKSWFIDFDPVRAKAEGREPESMDAATAALFPTEFEESALGLIPRGWTVRPFSETVDVLGGGTPKTSVPEYWGGDVPWFSVVDAPGPGQVFTTATEKLVTMRGVENSSTRILPKWTTIISARGTVGKLALTGVEMAMNQSCYGLKPKVAGGETITYLAAQRLVETLKRLAHGGVFDTITRDTLSSVYVCDSTPELVKAFNTLSTPLFERILTNGLQARRLSDIRDVLLPRLIYGKLLLPEAQEQIDEALA